MDRMTGWAVLAAVLSTFALAACGGDSSSTPTTSTDNNNTGGTSNATVEGVSTPQSVSVVTAKNAN